MEEELESLEEVAVGGEIWRLLLYVTEWLKICRRFWERWNYCKKKLDWALTVLLWDRIDKELKSEGDYEELLLS